MVTSIHLKDVGAGRALAQLSRPLRPDAVPGLRYAASVVPARLGRNVLLAPRPRCTGLIAAWDDDAALDAFLAGHPVARSLDGGYRVRMKPVRIVGAWPQFGEFELDDPAGNGPFAVLTIGRLNLRRAPAFLRASARAEQDVLDSPGLVMATGLARPPGLVSTFSVWRDAASMRAYVARGGHSAATKANSARGYHHESAFVRFRPYDEVGGWDQ